MSVVVDRLETHWLIRLDGECSIASAPELKNLLVEWLASGKELRLDLESAGEIDVAVLQLLWATEREAERSGTLVTSRVSVAAACAARDLGFDHFPAAARG